MTETKRMTQNSVKSNSDRLKELGSAPIGRMLLKYSLPAVIGTVVTSLYNIIDSMVIGHAIDDPNVVAGIAITFPVMNISAALGMLIGAGAATRVSIVLGQNDKRRAETVLGNSFICSLIIGITYLTLFAIFLNPILYMFGASPHTAPYAHEFLMWLLPGMLLINLTFSFNNVMRASGYPGKAMYTNMIGACLNVILAPLFLFVFKWGIRGAAIATDLSMMVTAIFVLGHFTQKKNNLVFKRHGFRWDWKVVGSVLYIGMSPFMINLAGAGINAIINNSLLEYGGDDAIAAVVVFNRYVTLFTMIVMGICQGMQPILGYNYGSRRLKRLFGTLKLAALAGFTVTTIGCIIGMVFPRQIASMFMQDENQIRCAIICLRTTTLGFWMVGYQIVATNFFQSLGMAGKAVFLSLTRQILFMIPLLMVLPGLWGLRGVWAAFPISDVAATIVSTILLIIQIRKINHSIQNTQLSA